MKIFSSFRTVSFRTVAQALFGVILLAPGSSFASFTLDGMKCIDVTDANPAPGKPQYYVLHCDWNNGQGVERNCDYRWGAEDSLQIGKESVETVPIPFFPYLLPVGVTEGKVTVSPGSHFKADETQTSRQTPDRELIKRYQSRVELDPVSLADAPKQGEEAMKRCKLPLVNPSLMGSETSWNIAVANMACKYSEDSSSSPFDRPTMDFRCEIPRPGRPLASCRIHGVAATDGSGPNPMSLQTSFSKSCYDQETHSDACEWTDERGYLVSGRDAFKNMAIDWMKKYCVY